MTCLLFSHFPIALQIIAEMKIPIKKPCKTCLQGLVEEDGFGPSKSKTTDLQSAPFGHSGTPPYWSWWTDLNPRPADYKSAALPTELHQHKSLPENYVLRYHHFKSSSDLISISRINAKVNTFFDDLQIVHNIMLCTVL